MPTSPMQSPSRLETLAQCPTALWSLPQHPKPQWLLFSEWILALNTVWPLLAFNSWSFSKSRQKQTANSLRTGAPFASFLTASPLLDTEQVHTNTGMDGPHTVTILLGTTSAIQRYKGSLISVDNPGKRQLNITPGENQQWYIYPLRHIYPLCFSGLALSNNRNRSRKGRSSDSKGHYLAATEFTVLSSWVPVSFLRWTNQWRDRNLFSKLQVLGLEACWLSWQPGWSDPPQPGRGQSPLGKIWWEKNSTSTFHYILLVPLTGYASDQRFFLHTHTNLLKKRKIKMQSSQVLCLAETTYKYSDIITSDLGEVSFSVTFNFY